MAKAANLQDPHSTSTSPDDRRGFIKRVAAILIGAVATAVPAVAGLVAFLDPLARRRRDSQFVPIVPLDALPADGIPRLFPVVADRTDAWNKFPAEPVGAVYLVRAQAAPDVVMAFTAACPHLGCFVSYRAEGEQFYCPCHQSRFRSGGEVIQPSPAERGLDTLEVKLADMPSTGGAPAGGKQVLVKFQQFRAGGAQKTLK